MSRKAHRVSALAASREYGGSYQMAKLSPAGRRLLETLLGTMEAVVDQSHGWDTVYILHVIKAEAARAEALYAEDLLNEQSIAERRARRR